jgi:hypothetical protein
MDPPRMQELSSMERRDRDAHIYPACCSEEGRSELHNGICASSPYQVIGLEWPCPRHSRLLQIAIQNAQLGFLEGIWWT